MNCYHSPYQNLEQILPEAVIHFLYRDSMESCLENAEKYPCDRETVKAISAQIAAVCYRINNM